MDIFLIVLSLVAFILLIRGWITNKANHPGNQPGQNEAGFMWFSGDDGKDSGGDGGGDSFDGGSADGGGGDSSSF